jgi:AhpD family alkylhydroperoxidase
MKTNKPPALSEKDQEVIAVGASIASGCLPCTKFHLRAASRMGANEHEILQAARDATHVRTVATEVMAKAGGLPSTVSDQSIADSAEARSLIRELVSIGAAYAINCSTSLGSHIATARSLGATDGQILVALKIARGIGDVARGKAEAAVTAVLGVSDDYPRSCECTEADSTSTAGASCCVPDARAGTSVGVSSCCQTEDTLEPNAGTG